MSLVVDAFTGAGSPAVLKLQYPDRESEHEAAALARWEGRGAVRLLAHDAQRRALLLERCTPGTSLTDAGEERALDVICGLVPRLAVSAAGPFRSLGDEARRWAVTLPTAWERAGRPFERSLLEAGVDSLTHLAANQGPPVLVNQDLHPGNVLAAEREPWLVIDPKPLAGEREFAPAPIIRAGELDPERVVERLDVLSGGLGLDRERVRGWALGHTLAWAFEGDLVLAGHVTAARRLHQAGRP